MLASVELGTTRALSSVIYPFFEMFATILVDVRLKRETIEGLLPY